MKITLPQNHLKEFLKLSSFIKNDELLIDNNPFYGCIKIEVKFGVCFLVKTGIVEFVKYNFDTEAPDQVLLVNEEKLTDFLSTSDREFVIINSTATKLEFNDGYNKPKFGVREVEVSSFPTQPKTPKTSIRISKEIISKINEVSDFVGKDTLRPFILYVHVKGDIIWTSDSQTSTITTIDLNNSNIEDAGFPLISISPKEAAIFSNFEYVDFFTTEYNESNWNLFKYNNCIYGSRLKDIGRDMTEFIASFKKSVNKEKYIKINVADFKNFCNSVVSYTKKIAKNFKSSELQILPECIKLVYNDAEWSIDYELEVAVKNFGYEKGFLFSHKTFLQLLNTIKYKDVCISNCIPLTDGGVSNACSIWSDEDDSFCFIYNKMQA